MLPVAITGIVSLADTALQTWNRIAESHPSAKSDSKVEFHSMLDKVMNGPQRLGSGPSCAQNLQSRVSALPEIQGALKTALPGSLMIFSVTPNGNLFQVLPGGEQRPVALSMDSQAILAQAALGMASPVAMGFQA